MAATAVIGGVGLISAGTTVYEGIQQQNSMKHMAGPPPAPDPNANAQTAAQVQAAEQAQRQAQGAAATLLDPQGGKLQPGESLSKNMLYGS